MSTNPLALRLWVLSLTIALLFISGAAVACQSNSAHQGAPSPCLGSPIVPISVPQEAVDELGLDITVSTESASLRDSYKAAALALGDQAASNKAALQIVAFGASGVGATTVFEGSFAPTGDDDVYNLAAENRARCWAKRSISQALATRAPRTERGTDVAGTLASLVADARSLMARGGTGSVTLLTDGCQAPALTGPNRRLTDLCGLLASGVSPGQILRAHAAEFSLPDANGMTIAMRGVGIGRKQNAASTLFARRLAVFWATVCRSAHARTCRIGSAVS